MSAKMQMTILLSLGLLVTNIALASENGPAPDQYTLSLIRVAKPVDDRKSLFSAKDFLEKSFNNDELNALTNERALASCLNRTKNRAQFYNSYQFESGRCATEYSAPGTKIDSVRMMKTATNRMLYRVATDQVNRSPVLSALVNGKVDFNFSFSELIEKMNFSISSEDEADRPVYVLQVADLANNLGLNLNDEAGQKKIIEQWPTKPVIAPETLAAQNTFGKRLAQRLGIAHAPFSKFKLKVEKTAPGFVMAFAIRFQELNDMAYADLTSLVLHGDKQNIKYGYRVPYKAHAIGGDYAFLNADPVLFYSYTVTGRGYGKVLYNTLNQAVGVEVAMSI